MLRLPGKNIAFAFSDPAGANACIALAEMYFREKGHRPYLFSNRSYSGKELHNFHLVDSVPAIDDLKIDCLFTGTSHPESSSWFEVSFAEQAKQRGIYTISFVDHWVNFQLRFFGKDGRLHFPDEIWVVDEMAKQLAIEEGLPEEKIVISGNPYHHYIKNSWRSSWEGKSYLSGLGIPEDGFHILFAPDPLSIRNGKQKAGFTEGEAVSELISILNEISSKVRLIVKLHPLQPVDAIKNQVENFDRVYLVQNADVLELVQASDLVIGFYSNILLDAEALGKEVIRYFPGNLEADLLKYNTTIKRTTNKNELFKEIKHCLYGQY